MTTVALQQALKWHDDLMNHFFTGRKDKDSAVRFRLSKASGVPESYLVRLAHKRRELRSLDAEIYRLLNLAHAKYVRACERIEGATEAKRQEWLRSEAEQEHENPAGRRGVAQMDVEALAEASGEKVRTAISGKPSGNLGAGRQ
jgi:hypothetical protein